MDLLHSIWLALVQGLTEFLPVSSSAHLILMPRLLGWTDQGLAFDVAVHLGTLCAVIWYFRDELGRMARAWLVTFSGGELSADGRLAWGVLLGTIPVGMAGLAIAAHAEELRDPMIIAGATAGFGLLLLLADVASKPRRDEYGIGFREIMMIGLAQAFALIPGASRSGITITAGLALGMTREAAARFSFLLSIPVIALAAALELWTLLTQPAAVDWLRLANGFVVAFFSAYLTIRWFLLLLERSGMLPFVIYRLLLAGVIIGVFWSD
ncbi:MAG: undecaprenyl-diphosphate phosphatase [Gammaproteobacteria bacterium]|nr:undecaprenyl-diphosphate phosphatase [Gammaproteobacteria bacterium]MCZ6716563.1 undecaprenyl-diphosphate phosphatase [Gammaproteobacteria bacterium]MCZ6826267.1 undecaprenyl-diphosphate phosphatase [Gammaproteobacteria bacterium]MCZ6912290.1 undecaprenyl-diphosphate phosphatase [Pseudomonadota bacterium]